MLPQPSPAQNISWSNNSQNSAQQHSNLRNRRTQRFLSGRQSLDPTVNLSAARQAAIVQHIALVNANAILPHSSPLTATWQPVGPTQVNSISYGAITGRISSIAIDTSDATGNTVYLGTTGGGVWKSTNAAGTASSVAFTPLTDNLSVFSISSGSSATASLSIGAVTVQPNGTGVILAGTGDTNDALDSYFGEGILRSSNSGQTWSLIQSSQDGVAGTHSFIGNGFAGFAWSTSNTNLVVAAVLQSAEGVIVNAPTARYSVEGLYYSTNSGASWQMATLSDSGQTVQSASTNFSSYFGNAITSVVWNPIRQRFYAAVRSHGFYYSTDGINWSRLANQPGTALTTTNCPANPGTYGSPACPIFRGRLAVDATTGDTFAISVDANNIDQGLWQDVCNLTSGHCTSSTETFAQRLNSAPLEIGSSISAIAQADYDLYLAAVHSGTDTLLFAGTEDIFRCSLSAGCTFRNTSNAYSCAASGVAPSQHAVDFLPAAGPLLYFGNDGGLWRSTDGVNQQSAVCSADDATHFQNLNSGLGSLAEVVSLAAHPSDPTQLLTGLGANGTAASDGSAGAWLQLSSGEGGTAAIDPINPLNWFINTNGGISINLCTQGSSCTAANFATAPQIGPTQVSSDQALMDAPYILDPALSSQLIAGTCRIWRGPATGGSSWSAANTLSPMLDGVSNSFCNSNAFVRSLAAGGPLSAGNGSQVLYAGMAGLLDGGGIKSGHIFSTTSASTANAGTAWTDLYSSAVTNDFANSGKFNPGNFDISSIAVDPHDATGMTVYAAVMGFSGNAYSVPHVYMSTTGGASWTNITSNLPNTPANAVLVDPNDVNTVYVAMDTGVYVTQAVTTCGTATVNCWNVFGVGLPNSPVTQLAAIAGSGSSVLAAGTYGRGVWQLPLASTLPPTTVTLTPSPLTFASQTTNTSSTAQTITVTNIGTTPLSISSVAITGNFSQTNNCTSGQIPAGNTCTVNVIFSPTSTGTLNGTLTLTANVLGGTVSASLTGQGTAPPVPVITFSPSSLTFAAINTGSTSATQTITVTNSGNAALTISRVSLSGQFSETDNCTTGPIAIGSTCTLTVAFMPITAGPLTGAITLTANITGGTASVALNGTGIAIGQLTANPQLLDLGSVYYLSSSAPMPLTVQNVGTAPVQITTLAISSSFTETDNCANSTLAVNATCTVLVVFTPSNFFRTNGTITISSNASNSTFVAAVSGYAIGLATVPVTVAPTSLTFSATGIGSSSASQTITVSVSSTGSLNPPTITSTGDFSVSSTCTSSVYFNHPCTIGVIFVPTTSGTRTGQITISGNITGGPVTVPLTGTGVIGGSIAMAPLSLTFSGTQIGSSSSAQSVTLSNLGSISVNLNPPQITGDYSISANTCATTLAAAANCSLSVVFTPTASGTRTGTLSIANSGTGGTVSTTLSGTGLSPAVVSLTPTVLSFPNTNIGASSPVQNIVIANTGGLSATLGTAQISGDFIISSNTCTTTLAANYSCTVSILFSPTASGSRTGNFQIGSSVGTQSASLSGIGLGVATDALSPLSLTFAAQQQGTISAAQTVTLTNSGDNSLNSITVQITGDFTLVSGCGASLAGHSSCGINVSYAPKNIGAETGTLTLTDALRSQTVTLNGTGLAPPGVSLSPSAGINYGIIGVGSSSTAQVVTLTNNGGTPLTISGISITSSGDFAIPVGQNTCPSTLAAATSCTLHIIFTPLTAGPRTGTLSIADNATGGLQILALTGTGLDFTLTANGATTQTVTSGQQTTYSLTVTPGATGLTSTVAFTCTGAPTDSTCVVTTSPTPATLTGTVAVTVTVSTGVNPIARQSGNQSRLVPAPSAGTNLALAFLPAAGLLFCIRRRKYFRSVSLPVFLWMLISLTSLITTTGCGSGGRLIPTSPTTGTGGGGTTTIIYTTPTGTSTLNLSASSSGITHTVPLTLVVH